MEGEQHRPFRQVGRERAHLALLVGQIEWRAVVSGDGWGEFRIRHQLTAIGSQLGSASRRWVSASPARRWPQVRVESNQLTAFQLLVDHRVLLHMAQSSVTLTRSPSETMSVWVGISM